MAEQPVQGHSSDDDHHEELTLEEALARLESVVGLSRIKSIRIRRGVEGFALGYVFGLMVAVAIMLAGSGPGHEWAPQGLGQILLVGLGIAVVVGAAAALDGPGVRRRRP